MNHNTEQFEGQEAEKYVKSMYGVSDDPYYNSWVQFIRETFTPNIKTSNILDVGCGDGANTRFLRTMTTGEVFGFDCSHDMIKLAASQDQTQEHHINYQVADLLKPDLCASLGVQKEYFDLVTASWVLQSFENKEMLSTIAKNVFDTLKKGGVFITVTLSPFFTVEDINKHPNYNKEELELILKDGYRLHFCLRDKEGKVEWEGPSYHHSSETLTKIFLDAGFSEVKFSPLGLAKELTIDGIILKATK